MDNYLELFELSRLELHTTRRLANVLVQILIDFQLKSEQIEYFNFKM